MSAIWEFDREKMLRQLRLTQRGYAANDAIFSAQQSDLLAELSFLQANADYFRSEMGYQDARKGRLTLLSESRIRELRGLRKANFDLGAAQVGADRARIAAEAAVDRQRGRLEGMQEADLRTALIRGTAVQTARSRAISSERAAFVAQGDVLDAQAGAGRATLARIHGSRGRVQREARLADEQLATGRIRGASVLRQQRFTAPTRDARRASVAAGRATLGGEAALRDVAATHRREARTQQLTQEVGEAAVSGAVRGHTGSYQEVRAAVAEQEFERDMARFAVEDKVESLKLVQRDRELDQQAIAVEKEHAAEVGRLDVAAGEARVSQRQALVAQARAGEAGLGLDVELEQARVSRRRVTADRARVAAGLKQLQVRDAEVRQVQDRLRATTRQGLQGLKVEEAARTGRGQVRAAELTVASRRNALVSAQSRAVGEQITREGVELQEQHAVATLARARSARSRARELRERAVTQNVESVKLGEKIKLQNFAEAITRWQIQNLPSAKDYEKRGSPSDLSLIFQGLELLFG